MCQFAGWCAMPLEAQAAWAQAFLSAVAIVFAGMLPSIHARKELRRKIDTYVMIINDALGIAEDHLEYMRENIGTTIWAEGDGRWPAVQTVFKSIPIHEVPDYRLYGIINEASDAFSEARDIFFSLRDSTTVVSNAYVAGMKRQVELLRVAYQEAADISNGLGGLNIRGRTRYGWTVLRSKLRQRIADRRIRKAT